MFRPGAVWKDTDGRPIQAHGGGVLYDDGTYYWYGENKDAENKAGYRVDVIGVSCYSSSDLIHWRNEGLVLEAVPSDPEHDLHPSKVVERPKVIYNERTKTYVMWMHIDHGDYRYARTGVAVSSTPTGPFLYQGSFRPSASDSRDMTVFRDDDGAAYLIFSSEWNSVTKIVRLTPDYLSTQGECTRVFDAKVRNGGRESPALFKRNGTYFMITSGCTGWDPNPAEYATAPSVLGPWTRMGNPCIGRDADTTFHAQSTFVLPIAGRPGAFIFMADRWKKEDLRNSTYVWLPIQFGDNRMYIEWQSSWDLSCFDE